MNKRVALGMSGGVDSSVAVKVLLDAGYEVLGVTCAFQASDSIEEAVRDAAKVCERFGIQHYVHHCERAFEEKVVSAFVQSYLDGMTPSPCVGCNQTCKFPQLIAFADEHDCDYIATGHYARIAQLIQQDQTALPWAPGRYVVKTALDHTKDQSYMLGLLSQETLARTLFPLGGLTKTEVRIFAAELGLEVADKEDSQDICFASQGYRELLLERGYTPEPGDIVNTQGKVLGKHTGLADYTVGQRKGIGVAAEAPLYVIAKDARTNQLVVGFADEARISQVETGPVNWLAFEELTTPIECMVKLRYRSTPAACTVVPADNGAVKVVLESSQSSTAPGQFAVFYVGSILLGASCILGVG